MVAIGRALMSGPRLLLLDEPSGGLSPQVLDEIAQVLKQLKRGGLAMLMVEQNIGLASAVCDQFTIIRDGVVDETGRMHPGAVDEAELARRIYIRSRRVIFSRYASPLRLSNVPEDRDRKRDHALQLLTPREWHRELTADDEVYVLVETCLQLVRDPFLLNFRGRFGKLS